MAFEAAVTDLNRHGLEFSLLAPHTSENESILERFEKQFPIGSFAYLDWSTARDVDFKSADNHADLFDKVERGITSWCEQNDELLYVITFDGNEPILKVPSQHLKAIASAVIEEYPLWVVSFDSGWVMEWRRSGEASFGYF